MSDVLERGAGGDSKDGLKQTPLFLSAKNGHKEVVTELLTCDSVDMNSRDFRGRTALMMALVRKHEAVMELLLRSKKVDIKSRMIWAQLRSIMRLFKQSAIQ